ncbi:Cell cycle serine/threonine-protein kinase cdc5/MSD2 [Trapelia coarctata]|nr:Cell cycle serine/threonine-protein kinase cdc5/MSD2 [Trapelia coarctata]
MAKSKDKNHAFPPPSFVIQPPGRDGLPSEKYSMGKELGKGGFAICYEGTLVGQKRGIKVSKFALKIVKAKMGLKKMEEKFKTELQIHSKMRHPNIVEFHRAFTYEENTYIVLELCPNGSVKDMVQKRRCLSLPEVRRYGLQLCGAIKYLHSRNVIHRDLKMGNIFLDQDMNIKLGDFGLAAILLTESDIGAVKRRTTLCGTPNYIAPEILERGRKGHDYKVDIWALGVIFFALLTGYPPFSDKVQEEIYRKVKSLEYTWPVNTRNDYPEEAKSLVTSLLKTCAEERPEPDQIVTHPFFSMHGGNAMPSLIEQVHFSSKPSWLEDGTPRGDTMALEAPRISLQALAEQCGVGSFSEKPYSVVGEQVGKSIYQELVWEESVGRAPTVPLPEDFVYTTNSASIPVKEPKPVRAIPRRPASMRIPKSRTQPTISTISAVVDEPKKAQTMRSRSVTKRSEPSIPTEAASEPKPTLLPPRSASNRDNPIILSDSVPEPKPAGPPRALIGPNEPFKAVPGCKPTEIVSMLTKLYNNLTKCLQDATKPPSPNASTARLSPTTQIRPHVVKWVDYTNKFGIGYILANGNIGCVFNGTESRASTCIMVPDSETHLRKRDSASYTERHQLIPRHSPPVTFLENRGEQGIECIRVAAKYFQITVNKQGVPEKLNPVANTFENEKRRMLSLWDKFAKYMTQTLGEKAESVEEVVVQPAGFSSADAEQFVKFYQRLGNVGIWAFSNASFQFNFPDHTKLVISTPSSGSGSQDCWADFYHLSVSAANMLKKGRILPKSALEEREVLSFPLQVLLGGKHGEKDFANIILANELVRKVRFVREVLGAWARNGGLGNMGRRARELKWDGLREEGGRERLVWVSVGRGGGDERFEAEKGKGA